MTRLLALLAGPCLACTPARADDTPAAAQPAICAPTRTVAAYLEEHFGETPRAAGIESDETVVAVFVSPRGTWTLVRLRSGGVACVIAAGAEWTRADRPH